jgi:TolA-binding protein
MHYLTIGLAIALASTGKSWSRDEGVGANISAVSLGADSIALRIPAAWLQGDPADSLYRSARESLSRGDYQKAASLFASIPSRYPRSGYAGDALYWQAFALYRLGSDGDLRSALGALAHQRKKYAGAATQGDAATLEQRIQGELARRGFVGLPDAANTPHTADAANPTDTAESSGLMQWRQR